MATKVLQKQILLSDGSYMPKLGQGTWMMGIDDTKAAREIEALQYGIDLGMNMIDTAELYGEGKAENIAGNAIKKYNREDIYIVSKVVPENASKKHMYSSLECSLKLLGTDYLDMYLLHWRADADIAEVVYIMEDLKDQGKIKRWGVSGFEIEDMEELWTIPDGKNCCVNQVLYNLGCRGIEYDLIPWAKENNVAIMAYSPVGRTGRLVTKAGLRKTNLMDDPNVLEIAKRKGISVVQLLLAFAMRLDNVIAIPKAVGRDHIEENAAASSIILTDEEIEQLSRSFPAPTEKTPLERDTVDPFD